MSQVRKNALTAVLLFMVVVATAFIAFGEATAAKVDWWPSAGLAEVSHTGVHQPKHYDAPPPMTIDPDKRYTAIFRMENRGQFTVEFFPREAPITVNNFVFLARDGFYDGVTFHRRHSRVRGPRGRP